MKVDGVVKWFNEKKGYGFLSREGNEEDIFVRYSSIQTEGFRTLAEGDHVQFELEDGPKGLSAQNVIKQ